MVRRPLQISQGESSPLKKAALFFVSIFSLAWTLGPVQVLAQDVPVILIVPFDNATGNQEFDALEEGLPDLLTAFLTPYDDQLMIIDRILMEEIFAERSLSWQGFSEKDAFQKAGQLAQARYILRGSISGSANLLGINALLYETETTRLIRSIESRVPSNQLTSAVQDLAQQLAEHFETEIPEVPELPLEEDPVKSVNLMYGLSYYYAGQYEKALTYTMKILENDADDELGRYWLARSFLGAGLEDHARLEFQDFLARFPDSPKAGEIRNELERVEKKEDQFDVQ